MNEKWNEALEAIKQHLGQHDPEGHSIGLGFHKIPMDHIHGLHTLHAKRPLKPKVEDTSADAKRLQSDVVGYMETDEGRFSCGKCRSLNKDGVTCDNPKVEARVSKEHGCCNLFFPAKGEPFPASKWKVNEGE